MPKGIGNVTETAMHRHGLERVLNNLPQGDAGQLMITIHSGRACFSLRGDPGQSGFTGAVAIATGQALPLKPNTCSFGNHRIFWQGPDEWMIETEQSNAEPLQSGLTTALKGMHCSLTDISGSMISLTLAGDCARQLLAKGCTLDLSPDRFTAGDCAQTGLAKANILIASGSEPVQFDLFVRRSFGEYLLRWLNHAGREFDIRFRQS